jgi:molybdate transport system substrate-binding protein
MLRWARISVLAGVLAAMVFAASAGAEPRAATVAAAANLKFVLETIAADFRAGSGRAVRLVFGSSGNLVRQIEQGAPFEIFLSADEQHVFRLADKGLTRDRGVLYARGRIVLFVPQGSPVKAQEGLPGLRAALDSGALKRFAIANPEHAPYGRAAEQALRKQELWERLRPLLVYGENVSQAAQFAALGSAQAGIIPYSLALAPELAQRGAHALIPENWHDPIDQRMVLLRNAGETAARFFAFVQTEAAQAVLRRYGFIPPER